MTQMLSGDPNVLIKQLNLRDEIAAPYLSDTPVPWFPIDFDYSRLKYDDLAAFVTLFGNDRNLKVNLLYYANRHLLLKTVRPLCGCPRTDSGRGKVICIKKPGHEGWHEGYVMLWENANFYRRIGYPYRYGHSIDWQIELVPSKYTVHAIDFSAFSFDHDVIVDFDQSRAQITQLDRMHFPWIMRELLQRNLNSYDLNIEFSYQTLVLFIDTLLRTDGHLINEFTSTPGSMFLANIAKANISSIGYPDEAQVFLDYLHSVQRYAQHLVELKAEMKEKKKKEKKQKVAV